jgi:hypothetical protein
MAIGFMNNNNQTDNGFCTDANYAVSAAVKTGSFNLPTGFPKPEILEIDVRNCYYYKNNKLMLFKIPFNICKTHVNYSNMIQKSLDKIILFNYLYYNHQT